MNSTHANPQKAEAGFWKRLVLAAKAMCESDEECLERRVSRLEAEVARLSEIQKQRAKG